MPGLCYAIWEIDDKFVGESFPVGAEEDLWEPVALLKTEEKNPRFLRRCDKEDTRSKHY
ncbi:MAG: hypothetical protein WC650_01035 [Candidatus Doudnabacteria bacterium]